MAKKTPTGFWEVLRKSFPSNAAQTDISVCPGTEPKKNIRLHFMVIGFQNVQRKQSACIGKDHIEIFFL